MLYLLRLGQGQTPQSVLLAGSLTYHKYVFWHRQVMARMDPADSLMRRGPAHRGPAFLPWHREFLFHFENALRASNPSVVLPYWDWTTNRTIPAPLANAAEWGVSRDMGPGDSLSASLATETYGKIEPLP